MSVSATPGPHIVFGQVPQLGSGQASRAPDYNPDRSYSATDMGFGLLDPRLAWLPGASNTQGTTAAAIIPSGGGFIAQDFTPAVLGLAVVAAAANAASGVPMTLVSAAGGGIGVLGSAAFHPPTGITVPLGTLVIDQPTTWLTLSQNNLVVVLDARTTCARALQVTGAASGTGGAFLVSGADLYGVPMTELITATAGATSVSGKKAFKYIYSVTPQFTDAHTYSVGTTDVFGFPVRVDEFFVTTIYWNNGSIGANTGFLAAVTTNPATNVTGDVRGTYAVQSASDGTKKLQTILEVVPWNAPKTGDNSGIFGVTQA